MTQILRIKFTGLKDKMEEVMEYAKENLQVKTNDEEDQLINEKNRYGHARTAKSRDRYDW